jgi:hypothetical protein
MNNSLTNFALNTPDLPIHFAGARYALPLLANEYRYFCLNIAMLPPYRRR